MSSVVLSPEEDDDGVQVFTREPMYLDHETGEWAVLEDSGARSYDSEGNDPPVNTTRLFANLRAETRGRFDA